MVAFVPSAPGRGAGVHRYAWLVFAQPALADLDLGALPLVHGLRHVPVASGFAPRRAFDPRQWQQQLGLTLVAGELYRAQYDAHCDAVHARVQAVSV